MVDVQTLTQIISMLELLHCYRESIPIDRDEELEALIKKLEQKRLQKSKSKALSSDL